MPGTLLVKDQDDPFIPDDSSSKPNRPGADDYMKGKCIRQWNTTMGLFPDFSQRSDRPELMDDLTIDGPELQETLGQLERINAAGRGPAISLAGINSLMPPAADHLSVLDVGAGSGDIARQIHRWAATRPWSAETTGIDLSRTTIEYARRRTGRDVQANFEVADLFDLPDQSRYDVVHASLVLHHFPGRQAASALAKMLRLSRWGVVVNDLHRHPLSWAALRVGLALLTDNRLIRHDGPLSVLRGFSRSELVDLARQVGVPAASVAWQFPFRWLMVCPVPTEMS